MRSTAQLLRSLLSILITTAGQGIQFLRLAASSRAELSVEVLFDPRGGRRTSSQHWRTFVRNHATAIVAADFLVAITAGFQVLYVFVVMEVVSPRMFAVSGSETVFAAWGTSGSARLHPSPA